MFKKLFFLSSLLLDKRRIWCKVIICLVALIIFSENKKYKIIFNCKLLINNEPIYNFLNFGFPNNFLLYLLILIMILIHSYALMLFSRKVCWFEQSQCLYTYKWGCFNSLCVNFVWKLVLNSVHVGYTYRIRHLYGTRRIFIG